jgi:hypothetical protein
MDVERLPGQNYPCLADRNFMQIMPKYSNIVIHFSIRELTFESRRHKFGHSELDTNPPLDGRRRDAQFGKGAMIPIVLARQPLYAQNR